MIFFCFFFDEDIIMNPVLQRIDKIIIDLFNSLYNKIAELRIANRSNIKGDLIINYNIEHFFHVVLNHCFYNKSLINCIPDGSNLTKLCKSSLCVYYILIPCQFS